MRLNRLERLVCACCVGVLGAATLAAADADVVDAAKFRRPFEQVHRVNYGFDHDNDLAMDNCQDYRCGQICYDGHRGTDYGTPLGTPIWTAAPGVVSYVHNGCPDFGGRGDGCGGGFGNHVFVEHADGAVSIYAHMKLDSITVQVNDVVDCAQQVGISASSGNSTGPHLHFEWRTPTGSPVDPYEGMCSATSGWLAQGEVGQGPGDQCDLSCGCEPGQVGAGECGSCGQRQRTCQASCQWGPWTECEGQGECRPGESVAESCCDCGWRERSCSPSCEWGEFGACDGKNPPPEEADCTTAQPGVCAAGLLRCQQGCLSCEGVSEATGERCDGRDNDCDGEVDEGYPALDDAFKPPLFAAQVVGQSQGLALTQGGEIAAWAEVKNVGAQAWGVGFLSLMARPQGAAGRSVAWHESWRSDARVTVNAQGAEPGQVVRFEFMVGAASDAVEGDVVASFEVVGPGEQLLCPEPRFTLPLKVTKAVDPEPTPTPSKPQPDDGCAQAGGSAPVGGALLWGLMIGVSRLRLKRRKRV